MIVGEIKMGNSSGQVPAGGKYKQKTIRIDPAWVEGIAVLAAEQRITVADAERWIIARGLSAYYIDQEKPRFEQPETRTVVFPEWLYRSDLV